MTEIGDCGGLYVSRKTPHIFEVMSRAGASGNGTFDYRLVARRKDIDGRRMEKIHPRNGRLTENIKLPSLPDSESVRRRSNTVER